MVEIFVEDLKNGNKKIFADGALFKEVASSIFKNLKSCSIEEEKKQWFSKMERKAAYIYALKLLARRNLASTSLRKKMLKLKVSLETVIFIEKKLKQMGFLDDQRWVEGFLARELMKGNSLKIAKLKLRSYGYNPLEFESIFQSLKAKEGGAILEMVEKRLKRGEKREKILRYILRKGFSYEEAVEMLCSDTP